MYKLKLKQAELDALINTVKRVAAQEALIATNSEIDLDDAIDKDAYDAYNDAMLGLEALSKIPQSTNTAPTEVLYTLRRFVNGTLGYWNGTKWLPTTVLYDRPAYFTTCEEAYNVLMDLYHEDPNSIHTSPYEWTVWRIEGEKSDLINNLSGWNFPDTFLT